MKCPRWLPTLITPLYRIRGRMVERKFSRTPPSTTRLERLVRRACERGIDAVEMWQYRPALERFEAQVRAIEEINQGLRELAEKYGVDITSDARSPGAEGK